MDLKVPGRWSHPTWSVLCCWTSGMGIRCPAFLAWYGTFAEPFCFRAPPRVRQCLCWNLIETQLFPLLYPLPSYPFRRNWSHLHSIIDALHANLRIKSVLPAETSLWCMITSIWRQICGQLSGWAPTACQSPFWHSFYWISYHHLHFTNENIVSDYDLFTVD